MQKVHTMNSYDHYGKDYESAQPSKQRFTNDSDFLLRLNSQCMLR